MAKRKLPEELVAQVRAIRLSGTDFELIKRAAELDRRPVSQFIAVAAIERAERILAGSATDVFGKK